MERANFIELYSKPDDYKPPEDISELRTNTQYPNLNSKEYRNRPVNRVLKIQQFFETFSINEEGEVILASNSIRGRIWNGSVWGFKEVDDVGKEEKSCFRTQCDSPVTNLSFINNNTLFLLTTANGSVQLWSSKAEVRNAGGYCLFMIDGCHEHNGIVLSMDYFVNDGTKAVTGSSDCCIKIWNVGADLSSIQTWRYAHSDHITGISAGPSELGPIFVSCSRDKSALIWDYRQIRPAIGLYENHCHAFTAILWSKVNVEKNNQIILGDESGKIYFVDTRKPNNFLQEHKIYNRPIRKISCHSDRMVVIGNTSIVKAFKLKDDEIEEIYKNTDATNFIRDVQWDHWKETEFYTIGWHFKLDKHILQ